ncbi:TetR/AcrR family transcriptional regulator [Paractinoplanes atraurantiacus]|uniref:DNA-binding transcriptional regulator, AcrR family n=1 Tax=Paractinoplanes atraurantiacus TaxID=1036182 RepID=A0A285ISH2_9ACTN|nr:TetR family transcriptional regulator [Actinoplanes atraurantiacus]SNY50975.1 DNA-binding transcriptional regulator, AcrR family [Actinoplanes atraurantiacus]
MVRRSGRRPGNQDTRASILEAARSSFAEKGFDKASIRSIAAGAGVDPALVHHYFGTKEKLFLAALNAPINPGELIPQALAGPREQAGERLVRMALSVWDSPAGAAALAVFRSALSNEWTARLLREFVVTQILRRAVSELVADQREAPMRSALVATQIAGLMVTRYVLRIEPLASADPALLAAMIGPNVQRFLTEPLDLSLRSGGTTPGAAGEPDRGGR